MKTIEINERKTHEKVKGSCVQNYSFSRTYWHSIPNLISNRSYETDLFPVVVYTDYLIYIFININGNIRN